MHRDPNLIKSLQGTQLSPIQRIKQEKKHEIKHNFGEKKTSFQTIVYIILINCLSNIYTEFIRKIVHDLCMSRICVNLLILWHCFTQIFKKDIFM